MFRAEVILGGAAATLAALVIGLAVGSARASPRGPRDLLPPASDAGSDVLPLEREAGAPRGAAGILRLLAELDSIELELAHHADEHASSTLARSYADLARRHHERMADEVARAATRLGARADAPTPTAAVEPLERLDRDAFDFAYLAREVERTGR
ncbi:MAG TPA: DUF4142 domain-containing protein, partial [Planctomycetota bacterium]|nr:DUF4142 domain-containing protein [Planctomycetota bacterium]